MAVSIILSNPALSNSAQACAQQAGVSLDKDRLSEAREAAASGEAHVEKLQRSVKDRMALQERIMATGPLVEELSVWAEIDRAGVERRMEAAKLALAYNDLEGAEGQLNGIVADMEKTKEDCKPSIRLATLPSEYQINRFEDFQLTVSNEGNAQAQNIELSFEAPADFGPGEEAGMLRIDSLAAKHSQEARLNLCFSKEGKVPVMVTVNYEDHAGNALSMNPIRLTVTVVREGSPQQAVVAPAQPRKGGVIINARPILQGGFFLYKLAVVNHSGLGLADARVLLSYKREILRFHHISPRTLLERFKYLPGEGEREDVFYLGYLDPLKDQEVTAELFFHPYICTETVIESELCYRDTQGKKLSIDCEPKKFPCYCPTLGSTEAPNPAMLLRFIETAGVKDSRVEPIDTGVSLSSAFEVLKSVINEFGMASVGSDRGRPSPYHAEALFYGEEDGGDGNVLRYAVIGMVSQRQAGASDAHLGGTAEIHVACEARTKVTALLATLAERFSSKLEKQANIKRPIYVDMRDYKTVIKDSIIYKSSIATGGGESQIDGSVIGRSSVGPAISDPKTAQSAAKYQESYKRVKFNDGIVDEEERAFLENLSSMYSIPPEIVQAIERKVDREYEDGAPKPAQPAPRCPRCQASVRAGDVVCSNCGDLLKA